MELNKIKTNLLFSFILILLITSCSKEVEQNLVLHPEISKIARLNEDQVLLSKPLDFEFINLKEFFLTTAKGQIIKYDIEGKQSEVIEEIGTGPLEYINPLIIKVVENYFYVWDDQLLKLIKFELEGGMPISEYNFFSRAIKDFQIVDNYLITQTSGGNMESFIEVYDLNTGDVIYEVVKPNSEDVILAMNANAGGLLLESDINSLNFLLPSMLKLFRIEDLFLEEITGHPIIDDDFKVDKISSDPILFFNNNREKAINYLLSNSVVDGLFEFKDEIVIRAQIGKAEIDEKGELTSQNRRFKFYFLPKNNFNWHKSAVVPFEMINTGALLADNSRSLFMINEFDSAGNSGYDIRKINFNSN